MFSKHLVATRRPRSPGGADFEDTQPNADLPPETREIWRDSSLDLLHGLDIDDAEVRRLVAWSAAPPIALANLLAATGAGRTG